MGAHEREILEVGSYQYTSYIATQFHLFYFFDRQPAFHQCSVAYTASIVIGSYAVYLYIVELAPFGDVV